MTRLEKLRKRLGQCDEILLDAILMRQRKAGKHDLPFLQMLWS